MLRIITYHRVDWPHAKPRLDPKLISATPEAFRRQMKFVAGNYDIVAMDDLLAATEGRASLPRRALMVTFDDAYCDFEENAWPIMKELALPATVFVPTAYPDDNDRAFWWDRLHNAFMFSSRTTIETEMLGKLTFVSAEERANVFSKLRKLVKHFPHEEACQLVDNVCHQLGDAAAVGKTVLGWNNLRRLAKEGVALGPHTRTHPIMTQLTSARVREEVLGSHRDIKQRIGKALPIFCYPNGGHDDDIVSILRDEGFKVAFTVNDGQNDISRDDLLRLKRTNITPKSTLPIFRLRLTRWFSYVDRWRHRQRSSTPIMRPSSCQQSLSEVV